MDGRLRVGLVGGAAGLVVTLVGTFLPWLRSGRSARNSYATLGIIDRLLGLHGVDRVLAHAWPLLSLVCAAVAVLVALGARRLGAALAYVPAAAAGAAAVIALRRQGRGGIRILTVGPIVTLVGVCLTALAATVLVLRPAGDARHRSGRRAAGAQRTGRNAG